MFSQRAGVFVAASCLVLTGCQDAVLSPTTEVADPRLKRVPACSPVPKGTTSITLTPAQASVFPGGVQSFVIRSQSGTTIAPCNASWTTTSAAVATVNPAGTATGVAIGSALIRASLVVSRTQTIIASASLNVVSLPVASVEVTPGSATLYADQSLQLSATLRDSTGGILSGPAVTWSSANVSVATVSASGYVTAKSNGATTISATVDGKSGTFALTVIPLGDIYFGIASGNEQSTDIYAIQPDGSNLRLIGFSAGMDIDPRISPDRKSLLVVSERWCVPCMPANTSELYVANMDGSAPVRLTFGMFSVYQPTWSPDGARIAFASQGGTVFATNRRVYTANANGGGISQITSVESYHPDWSPNGSLILYATPNALYTIRPDGTGNAFLRSASGNGARWSPDGSKIAYEDNLQIFVMNADGTNVTQLTTGNAIFDQPAWAPDGKTIAYRSNSSGLFQLWRMNADGSNKTQISSLQSGGIRSVDWR